MEKPNKTPANYDVIIIGAGAAGLFCAGVAGQRGKSVLVLDHAKKIGEKIRIAGGGRCNFTNIYTSPDAFLSNNPHFCKSALKQYTQWDFIALVEEHGIAYHEKTLGQLFCNERSQQIIDLLLDECAKGKVEIKKETSVSKISKNNDEHYLLDTSIGDLSCASLVIATGGLSIPKIGASKFGYDIAKQFDLKVVDTAPALVPLTFSDHILEQCRHLSGLSVDAIVTYDKTSFREGLLFTHRGLSGPSILQISSYWREGDPITINLAPEHDILALLKDARQTNPKQYIHTCLAQAIPQRLAEHICEHEKINGRLADTSDKSFEHIANAVNHWTVKPNGTEGYRTAEVTRQGIDTDEISSKTMECKKHKNLFFIGEVVDVTGHLGGYNFQWAWSSGYVAGQNV